MSEQDGGYVPDGDEQKEFPAAPVAGTAVISGVTFQNRGVLYADIGGMAIVEGDITLGPVEEVEMLTAVARGEAPSDETIGTLGVGISGSRFRWPNRTVPYEVASNLPNQQRITDAVAHYHANTTLRWVVRTAANAGQFPNYVRFDDDGKGGSWSYVGMQGNGRQIVNLANWATTGTTIHEMGHAAGLWHEQSREDRDRFVTIRWANIKPEAQHNFSQHITDGDDLGSYDYGSIMHYPRNAFTRNGQDTIVPTNPNAQIGQRNGLSAGDIAAIRTMYPRPIVVPKKSRDDSGPKKRRDDSKFAFDPKARIEGLGVGRPLGSPVRTSGSLLPFSILTPHHAALAGAGAEAETGGAPEAAAYLDALGSQLLQLRAAMTQAEALGAQAAVDAAELSRAYEEVSAAYEEALGAAEGT